MKHLFLCALCSLLPMVSWGQVGGLERSIPEKEGVSSEKIIALFDSLMAFPDTEIHSVMLLRNGKVIAEMYPAPFRPEYGHQLFSCSKTFTATAVGLAIMDNRLRLDDRLAAFFPELLPDSVTTWLADITVRDLLTMTSGFEVDTKMRTFATNWIESYLHHPMVAEPGKRFAYDSIDTYLLSAIVQRVTGMKVVDYLKQRIFGPLGITEVYWEESPEAINTGGWGLYLQPESLAKFGQLLLNKGKWNGVQLLSPEWVKEMGTCHVKNNHGDDYGFQMWMCDYPGAFRADGAYGQYIIIIPDKDMVVVITQCLTGDGGKEQNYIWNTLLPYVTEAPLKEKHPGQLKKRCLKYELPLPKGKALSSRSKDFLSKAFKLEENSLEWESVRFEYIGKEMFMYVMDTSGKESKMALGYKEWLTSPIGFYPPNARRTTLGSFSNVPKNFKVGAGYAWTSPEVLEVRLHFVNWMSAVKLKFQFKDGKMNIVAAKNYAAPDIETIHEL